ncbi:MAG: phosphatidate cytidylyltransferase [Thermoguttaceae bacterium]|jgi:phosphatidate cytidylyltransferase
MLRWRLPLSVAIVGALAALCWLDAHSSIPGLWLLPALVAFTLLATAETLGLARAAGLRPLGGVVYLGNLLLVLGDVFLVFTPWLHLVGSPWFGVLSQDDLHFHRTWVLAAVVLATGLILLGEMGRYQKPGGVLANAAVAVLALVYVGVMLDFAVQIRMEWGVGAMASWIITVKMGDIGAYTTGRLIGRHKLYPRLSPGKTIEGAAGALVFSCAGAWASLAWLAPLVAGRPLWSWLVYGLLLGITGMLGDLAESVLKRDAGVKDSSRWMPGFGGTLDILDSLLLSAPVAWLCWSAGL